MIRHLTLSSLMLASCTTVSAAAPLTGNWGGNHIGLRLEASGGTLDYDCASGTIGPVVVQAGGRFTAEGFHSPGHGGPIRVDEKPTRTPTRYDGSVRGSRMTLRGRTATGLSLGPFTLERNAEPRILRCL